MSRILLVVLAFIAGVIATIGLTDAALAQKRVALVIGNGAYTKVSPLDNPKNDAAAMEAMFKAAGFGAVVRVNDLGVSAMRRALRDFSDTAHDADVAVVFYAGHGIEVGGVNYLIPTDAVLERDIDAPDEAISLDRINQVLEPVKHLRLVILDSCRDNPFARSMRRTTVTRQVRSGHGEIDERSLPPNTLVAYAQRAGFTAEDGVGSSNSPFTTALVKHLPTPGLDVELALRRVRDEVLRATKNRQEPFKYGSLSGTEIALVAASTGTATTIEPGGAKQLSEAADAWVAVKDSNNPAVLEAYVARYKETFYAELARARIEDLRKQQADAAKAEGMRKKAEDDARTKAADAERQRLALLQMEDARKRAQTPLTGLCKAKTVTAPTTQKGYGGHNYNVHYDFTRGPESTHAAACGREYWMAVDPKHHQYGLRFTYVVDGQKRRVMPNLFIEKADGTLAPEENGFCGTGIVTGSIVTKGYDGTNYNTHYDFTRSVDPANPAACGREIVISPDQKHQYYGVRFTYLIDGLKRRVVPTLFVEKADGTLEEQR